MTEFDVLNHVGTAATTDDAAIITIGRNAGEGNDRKLVNDYYLSAAEITMIKTVSATFHAFFNVTKSMIAEKDSKGLTPLVAIDEMKP